jgi:hypothetical protein
MSLKVGAAYRKGRVCSRVSSDDGGISGE